MFAGQRRSIFEKLECRSLMSAVTAASDPGTAFDFDGMAYFIANDGVRGAEVWRTDGTEAGTDLFLETVPGPGSELGESRGFSAIEFNGQMYFSLAGYMWKSDGTEAGTVKVSQQKIGWNRDPVIFQGAMYYSGNGHYGQGIYRSDGTEAGTQKIANIDYVTLLEPGSNGLLIVGRDVGTIVYPATGGPNERAGYNFYFSDGTQAGTVKSSSLSISFFGQVQTARLGDKIVLATNTSTISAITQSNKTVYITDGTSAGTSVITTNELATPLSLGSEVILFGATGIWKTNGTPGNLVEVANFGSGFSLSESIVAGPYVYFAKGGSDPILRRTDGTTGGTIQLALPANAQWGDFVGEIGNDLLFTLTRNGQSELWRTNGTDAGTQFVEQIDPQFYWPSNLGDQIIFRALSPEFSTEPYITDGTAVGTHVLKDINVQPLLEAPTVVPGQPSYLKNGTQRMHAPFVQLMGEAPAGSTVVLFNGDDELGRIIADSNGHYLFTPTSPLLGSPRIFANVAAPNGDVSPVEGQNASLQLYIDSTSPTASVALIANNGTHYVWIGFSEPIDPSTFSTANLILENLTTGQTIPAADMLLSPIGSDNKAFSLTLPQYPNSIFPDGDYRLTLINTGVTDPVGNQLRSVVPQTWTVQPLGLVTLTLGLDNGSSSTDGIVAGSDVRLRGTVRVGTKITVYVDGVAQNQISVSSNGTYTKFLEGLSDGPHVFTATATLDGVTSPHSAPLTVRVDTTAPTVAGMQFVAPGAIKVTFSENVDIQANALTLVYIPTGQAVPSNQIQLVFDNVTHVATFTVSSPLSIGKYRATLNLASIQDSGARAAGGISSLIFSNLGTPIGQQAVFSNRTLRLTGTSLDDRILVRRSPSSELFLEVFFNSQAVGSYAVSQVDLIQIDGGAGNDRLELVPDVWTASKIYGGTGHDTIIGGLGIDRVYGGEGNDWISGGLGNDIVYGEAGNDRIFGGDGRDYLVGGSGADVLRGENGADQILAKSGEDDYRGNQGDLISLLT